MKPIIGLLAVQGAFSKHQQMVERLNYPTLLVKKPEHLQQVDKLIIPGGESTTMVLLLQKHGLWQPLIDFAQKKAIFGTCAGSILLAKSVRPDGNKSLALMDMVVSRNSYGRQIDSFETPLSVQLNHHNRTINALFIRAPIIEQVNDITVKVLARHLGHPVLVQQKKWLACTFHPELSDNLEIHRYFLEGYE